jgi:hypothetical protein
VVSATIGVGLLMVRALRRPRPRCAAHRERGRSCALALAASAAILPPFCLRGGAGCEALERKASGLALSALAERVTDFDFDGHGLAKRPLDQAPFDASRHPFALDQPGNGIDENSCRRSPRRLPATPDEFVESGLRADTAS